MARRGETAAPAEAAESRGSFKLRFAAHCEPGRSNLSAIRPLGLPAPVTEKLGARGAAAAGEAARERRALELVRGRCARGPRDLYPHPVTTAHESVHIPYGWWCEGGLAAERGHHIRDSCWLRARLRLLAPYAAYRRR